MNNNMQNNLEGNYANYADRWMSALHVVGFQKKFSHGNQLFGWSSRFGFFR